jgi:hypothetical protein
MDQLIGKVRDWNMKETKLEKFDGSVLAANEDGRRREDDDPKMAVVALSPHRIAEMIVEDAKMMSQLSGRIVEMTLRMAVVALSSQRIAMIGKTAIVLCNF